MNELQSECEDAKKYLEIIRSFVKDIDTLSDEEAFAATKTLREEVGKFLDDMNFINLIDRPYLMYVGYPRFVQSLDDIGITNMELLLLQIIQLCEGKRLSLEENLKLTTKI